MANDLNKVLLLGRLTRDPEFKTVGGSSVTNFSLANNRVYVSNGEKKEETHYFDCVAWGKSADILKQYATKGKQLIVEGRLQFQSWDGPDGKKASKVRVYVETFQFLGSNSSTGSSPSRTSTSNDSMPEDIPMDYPPSGDDEEIPF
jgi:single-strand DNA-binding protein